MPEPPVDPLQFRLRASKQYRFEIRWLAAPPGPSPASRPPE
ncbi:MAG TPA: hypothetical protein VKY74_13235 [Chloroflexia bacterium]|nr:hypothetical protein [Chloroflexia bacterium]